MQQHRCNPYGHPIAPRPRPAAAFPLHPMRMPVHCTPASPFPLHRRKSPLSPFPLFPGLHQGAIHSIQRVQCAVGARVTVQASHRQFPSLLHRRSRPSTFPFLPELGAGGPLSFCQTFFVGGRGGGGGRIRSEHVGGAIRFILQVPWTRSTRGPARFPDSKFGAAACFRKPQLRPNNCVQVLSPT